MCWAVATGRIEILSDGTPWRPLVHVGDLARTAVALLEAPRDLVHNQAFNVGVVGENYQVRELVDIVLDTVGGATAQFAGKGEPDRRSYRVDFSRLRKTFPELELTMDARKGAVELRDAFQNLLSADDFKNGRYTRLAQLKKLLRENRIDAKLRWI